MYAVVILITYEGVLVDLLTLDKIHVREKMNLHIFHYLYLFHCRFIGKGELNFILHSSSLIKIVGLLF